MEDKAFIEESLRAYANAILSFINQQTARSFIEAPDGKWSIGQNLDHLNKSLSPVNLALRLPKIVPRLLFGAPNRKARTYHELIERYHQKLANGGTASGRFIPPEIRWEQRDALVTKFRKEISRMTSGLNSWREDQLDAYLLPHPLLGKLTVREMLFFSAYHISHHHQVLEARNRSNH